MHSETLKFRSMQIYVVWDSDVSDVIMG